MCSERSIARHERVPVFFANALKVNIDWLGLLDLFAAAEEWMRTTYVRYDHFFL